MKKIDWEFVGACTVAIIIMMLFFWFMFVSTQLEWIDVTPIP